MCDKELRMKIAGLSEFQAKIAIYCLCEHINSECIEDAVNAAKKYPQSEG